MPTELHHLRAKEESRGARSLPVTNRLPNQLLLAVALVIVCSITAFAAPPDEEAVERYLARLGLTDLQMIQLERLVDTELPREEKSLLAKRLADLYASRLMASSDDKARYQDTLRRIELLTAKAPEARTASLEVMLLQADYNRAETLVAKWMADAEQTQSRDEALRILQTIAPSLDRRRSDLKTQADNLTKALDQLENTNREFAVKEKELNRTQAVLGRASYFAAWSNYYLGLLTGAAAELTRSREIFREILGVEANLAEAKPDWLSLESVWRARALIGLGLAEAAAGQLDASRKCFELLRHGSVPAEIRDQAPYWYVRGLLNSGKLAEATAFAEAEIKGFTGRASQGRVSLCVALVRAGYGVKPRDAKREQTGMLGLSGLARIGQQKAIDQLVAKYEIPLEGATGFYLNWIRGRRLARAAKELKDKEKHREAAEALEAALKAPDVRANASAAAQCRYELAWSYYQLGQWETAARAYDQARIALKSAGDKSAPDAAWMAFVTYRELAKTTPRFATQAIEVLRDVKRDFPKSQYAPKVDFFINKLQRSNVSPEQAMRELESIRSDSPSYLSARYDLCGMLYEQWRSSTGAKRAAAGAKLRSAVTTFVAAAGDEGDPRRRAKCLLRSVDVALNGEPAKADEAAGILADARPLINALPERDSLAAEFHFRSLQLAGKRNDQESRRQHALWIVRNAPRSAFELPALVISARAIESGLKGGAEDADLRKELLSIYRRLVERLGDQPDQLKASKNSRVASSRLASYSSQLGQHAQAAAQLEKLLVAFPSDASYLRRAAQAHFQAGKFPASLVHWRKLVNGIGKGKPEWYEAKYHQLACLAKIDPPAAAKAFRQFELLYPSLGGGGWKARFEALKKSLP